MKDVCDVKHVLIMEEMCVCVCAHICKTSVNSSRPSSWGQSSLAKHLRAPEGSYPCLCDEGILLPGNNLF